MNHVKARQLHTVSNLLCEGESARVSNSTNQCGINFGKKQPCLALIGCCLNRSCGRNIQTKPCQPMADPHRPAVSPSAQHLVILFCGRLPDLGRLTNQTYLCTLRPMTGDVIKAASTSCLIGLFITHKATTRKDKRNVSLATKIKGTEDG